MYPQQNGQYYPQFSTQPSAGQPLNPYPTQVAETNAMSFEARIGLALRGSNWQALQNNATTALPGGLEPFAQDGATVDSDLAGSELDAPKEMTVKQKKKMKRFEQTIARDAGDVVGIIEIDSLRPRPESVKWEGDPDLLCCYNWCASTDGTNTIFGECKTLNHLRAPN